MHTCCARSSVLLWPCQDVSCSLCSAVWTIFVFAPFAPEQQERLFISPVHLLFILRRITQSPTPRAWCSKSVALAQLFTNPLPRTFSLCHLAFIAQARLEAFLALGITRVSMGVQSFDAGLLEACGRAHSLADVYQAVELLRKAKVDNFSIDLMRYFASCFGSQPDVRRVRQL